MTLTAILFVSSVFAQINLTVKNDDGTAANSAVVYTINSSDGTVTVIATDGAAGDGDALVNGIINFTPAANTTYIVRNTGSTAWNTYAGGVAATVVLRSDFATTLNDYVSGYTSDKVTINKAMPYWVTQVQFIIQVG